MTTVDSKTILLGAEHDDRLRLILREVLKTLASTKPRHEWSPDIETLDVDIEGRSIRVEAETYIGLSISGPADLVDRICELVKQRGGGS